MGYLFFSLIINSLFFTVYRLHTGLTALGASESDLRMSYLPVMKQTLMKFFKENKIDEVLEFMDNYGLSREDVMESFDDFCLDKDSKIVFGNLDAKVSA